MSPNDFIGAKIIPSLPLPPLLPLIWNRITFCTINPHDVCIGNFSRSQIWKGDIFLIPTKYVPDKYVLESWDSPPSPLPPSPYFHILYMIVTNVFTKPVGDIFKPNFYAVRSVAKRSNCGKINLTIL